MSAEGAQGTDDRRSDVPPEGVSSEASVPSLDVAVPPFLTDLAEFLQRREPEMWEWFATSRVKHEHADGLRLELLKRAYRLDPETHAAVYAIGQSVLDAYGIDGPLTLYQGEGGIGPGAGYVSIPDESHVVFYGPMVEMLDDMEMRALLGHELAHGCLLRQDDGAQEVVRELLDALCQDDGADPVHLETLRVMSLFTEVYADRGALAVCDDPHAVVSMLIKIDTGASIADPAAYIEQASEVISAANTGSQRQSHPEFFLRALALDWFAKDGVASESRISDAIRGTLDLHRLDLLEQEKLARAAQAFVAEVMQESWMQTDASSAHARLFMDDPSMSLEQSMAELEPSLPEAELIAAVPELWTALLADCIAADRSLEPASIARGCAIAKSMGLDSEFEAFIVREFKMRKTQVRDIAAQSATLLAEARDA